MLKRAALETAFQVYWNDMTKCVHAKAYWSLLHVTVCIPDICAALETPGGNVGKRYTRWCKAHLTDPKLSADERWNMRCKVLHQGRAKTDKQGRYTDFAFGQPAVTGAIDHLRVDGTTLHLDVGMMAEEMRLAVVNWIGELERDPGSTNATAVERNLCSLVRVTPSLVPVPSAPAGLSAEILKTN
jgi:hypothetical protein